MSVERAEIYQPVEGLDAVHVKIRQFGRLGERKKNPLSPLVSLVQRRSLHFYNRPGTKMFSQSLWKDPEGVAWVTVGGIDWARGDRLIPDKDPDYQHYLDGIR